MQRFNVESRKLRTPAYREFLQKNGIGVTEHIARMIQLEELVRNNMRKVSLEDTPERNRLHPEGNEKLGRKEEILARIAGEPLKQITQEEPLTEREVKAFNSRFRVAAGAITEGMEERKERDFCMDALVIIALRNEDLFGFAQLILLAGFGRMIISKNEKKRFSNEIQEGGSALLALAIEKMAKKNISLVEKPRQTPDGLALAIIAQLRCLPMLGLGGMNATPAINEAGGVFADRIMEKKDVLHDGPASGNGPAGEKV